MRKRLVLLAVTVSVVAASVFVLVRTAKNDAGAPPAQHIARAHAPAPLHTARSSGDAPLARGQQIAPAAIAVAVQYARRAFSTTAGATSDAWIRSVAPLCTRAWLGHLESAGNGAVMETVTDPSRVARVFSSWAPSHDVGATVLLVDDRGEYHALYVVLVLSAGHYLVGATE